MKPETLTPETLTLNPERERDCETALRCRSPRGVVAVIVRELRLWTAVPCLPLRLLHLLFSPRARTPRGQQHHRGCTGAAGSLAVRVRDGDERESAAKGEKTSGREKWGEDSGLRNVYSPCGRNFGVSPRARPCCPLNFSFSATNVRGRVLAGREESERIDGPARK